MLPILKRKQCLQTVNIIFGSLRSFSVEANNVIAEETQQKLLKVAIVGMPNAGKSTLINNLMSRKVFATSPKVHTTRANARAILNEGDTQVVFLDTPGVVRSQEYKKFNLEKSFWHDSEYSVANADIVGVIHDISNTYTREHLDLKIIRMLEAREDVRSVLILNKIDVLRSKRKLLDLTRLLTEGCLKGKPFVKTKNDSQNDKNKIHGFRNFEEIFMVSALTGAGVEDIRDYLVHNAKPGHWLFPPDIWTDQTPENIIVKAVKAILLQYLPQELPYQLKPSIELYDVDENGVVSAVVLVKSPSERITKLVCGVSDGRLRQMTEEVQQNLQNAFQNLVRLKIIMESNKSE